MNYFKIGKNKIAYISPNFREWFEGVEIKVPKKAKLYSKILGKSMLDNEILKKLKPSELTLGDVLWTMKNSKDILKNGYVNIFYVKDKNDVLRAVGVHWDGGGWDVFASPVADPDGWSGGSRVFSRNSFDTFETLSFDVSEPLSFDALELKVSTLEEDIKKLRKFLVL